MRSFVAFLIIMHLSPLIIFAQKETQKYDVYGNVRSANSDVLIGATIQLLDTPFGARTDKDGNYRIKDVPVGKYKIRVNYIGYESKTLNLTISSERKNDVKFDFWLNEQAVLSKSVDVVAARAKTRETPIAFSEISKEELQERLGGRDLPLILNETPGIYSTQGGGSTGDARISIRGFNQRNIAVMINGVPVNDMETGWVYWSNWDGIGDVTSSVQVQRGLGAARLAIPSIGGTMNITTDAAAQQAGVKARQEFGAGNRVLTSVTGNTGNLDGFALSASVTRRTEDGMVQNTWNDSWAYYLGMSYDINKNHQLDFYVIGANQQRARRSWMHEVSRYDSSMAADLGVAPSAMPNVKNQGISYNRNWGPMENQTMEFFNGRARAVPTDGSLSEVVNYFNKPSMNLNWYWKVNEDLMLSNVFYHSTGEGGGSRGHGPTLWENPDGTIAFNDEYSVNSMNIDRRFSDVVHRSNKVLINSVNNHFWVGWLGTADYKVSKELNIQFGGDVRYYEGTHYQEVRNLLGGDYYVETIRYESFDLNGNIRAGFADSTANLNNINNRDSWMLRLGDKMGYHYVGFVSWAGGFLQAEYKKDNLTTYLNLSGANVSYQREDFFRTAESPNGNITPNVNLPGFTAKTGANYNLTENINFFGNIGYYNRAPQFNGVFERNNATFQNLVNEKVLAIEGGAGYNDRNLQANLNYYYTNWQDRTWSSGANLEDEDGNRIFYFFNLAGIDALHTGWELDFNYRFNRWIRLRGMVSLGDWTWQNDVIGNYTLDQSNQTLNDSVFIKGLKVGDAAQHTYYIGITANPIRNSFISFNYNFFAKNYAEFRPNDRRDPNNRSQPWQMPNYGIASLSMGYSWRDLFDYADVRLRMNVFNLFDTAYIADAQDARGGARLNDAASARVFFGLPRSWNLGVEVNIK